MIKRGILSLLLSLISIVLFSQTGTIRGFVYNIETGEPVIFTNVVIPKTNYGASTDINGYFVISKVPIGKHTLKAGSIGYKESSIEIQLNQDQVLNVKIQIEEESKLLGAVEVSAQSQAARTESQVSIEKITAKDITQMPSVGGSADLAQYIQVLPGVVFTGDQGGQLYIRGGSAIQNKVILDGMVIFNPFHSIGLFSVFETDIIRNADVFTGGFGAKYGGRISSIMDITTRDGNKKKTQGKIGASTFGANLLLEGPIIKEDTNSETSLSYLITAKNSYLSHSSKKVYSYIDGALPYDFFDIYGKMTLSTNTGTKINLFAFNYTDQVNQYKSIANFDWQNIGIGGNFVILPPGNTSALVEGVFAYSDYTVNMLNTITDDSKSSNIGGFNVGLTTTNYFNKDQFKYGIEMIGNTTNTKVNSLEEIDYSTELGLFTIYKGIYKKLVYEPSFRLSYFASIGELIPEPRLALKYNITNSWRIKSAMGLYSQSFIDTKSDQDIVNLFTGYLTITPEMNIARTHRGVELDSYLQRSKHLIIGTEIDLTRFISLNIEGYYKTMENLVTINRHKFYNDDPEHSEFGINPQPDFLKKEYAIENGEAYGMDISLKYDDERLYLWAVYSLGKVVRQDELMEYFPHYDRRHNVNILFSYQLGLDRSWEVNLRWNYGSGFPYTPTKGGQELLDFQSGINYDYIYTNGELKQIFGAYNSRRLPDYHRFDISAKKRFTLSKHTILEVNVSVTNVYNRENLFYYDRISAQRVNQLPIMPSIGINLSF